MRVLWFSNTPSMAASRLDAHGAHPGGWIASLEKKIVDTADMQLALAFPWTGEKLEQFEFGKTSYYALPSYYPKGRVSKSVAGLRHSIRHEKNELKDYLKIIDEFKPAIIQIFGTERGYGLITTISTTPVVIHIQGNMTVYTKKWFSGISEGEVIRHAKAGEFLKGRGLFHDYYEALKFAEREKEIFRNCRYFMGRTDWDRRVTSILSPNASYYHCDEIMRDSFYVNIRQMKPDKKKLTIFSTIGENIYKGLETIVETAALLSTLNNFPFEWRVAGISPDNPVIRMVRGRDNRGILQGPVTLLGRKSEADLINEMVASDLFVFPSHIDNSPNSLCEAMLLGLPIVTTCVGGIPTLVRDRHEGLLVQDGDPYAMAGAIRELRQNDGLAETLGRNARATALKRHDPSTIVSSVKDIYADILSREKNRGKNEMVVPNVANKEL